MSSGSSWTDRALERAERALARAGVKRWEIAADEVYAAGAEAMDGAVEVVERSIERAVGIRVLDGGLGFAGRTEPTDDDLEAAVEAAIQEARRARPAAIIDFAAPADAGIPTSEQFLDLRATGGVAPRLLERALALEALALHDPRVARVRPARVDEERGVFRLRTSAGLEVADAHSRASASVGVIAEDDEDTQSAYAYTSGGAVETLDLESIAREAAEDAVRLLGAGSFRTGRVPVIFGFEAAAELVALLAGALEADRIERGASFLVDRLGAAVVSPALTLLDDPHDGTLDGACAFDGEGLATSPQRLVDRGVVARFLDDRDTAARAGRTPGGHGVRGGAGHRPHPGVHSLVVAPGHTPVAELLRRAEGGLWVHEVSGTHTMNEVTGELSLGASGWAVRGGARAEAVHGVTVAGALLAMLGGSVALSLETRRLGVLSVPAVLVEAVQVSAER